MRQWGDAMFVADFDITALEGRKIAYAALPCKKRTLVLGFDDGTMIKMACESGTGNPLVVIHELEQEGEE